MSGVLGIFEGGTATGSPACADVVIVPQNGNTPLNLSLTCSTPNSHIFYTKVSSSVGIDPVHTGDNAGANTIRIGSNSGMVSTGAGVRTISALAYEPSHLDSDITSQTYDSGG